VKEDDYVEKAIEAVQAKSGFKLIPDSPFKNILGIVDPELVPGVCNKWKSKFKTVYGHNIIEDEELLEREADLLEAKSKSHY
jgi:hypothetical protein